MNSQVVFGASDLASVVDKTRALAGLAGVEMETESNNTGDSLRLNMDFDEPVCMLPDQYEWVASPADGVARVPLERVSAESGEYGQYPEGSWIRSPHLSEHFPRVEEETLILVKVGHLPQA